VHRAERWMKLVTIRCRQTDQETLINGKCHFWFMETLVIQNSPIEDVGLYENWLQHNGIEYHVHHPYTGVKLPSSERFEAFIVSGTPIPIYEADKHDFLREEMAYLKAVVKKNRPYLGICGGAQLLAKLLGAEVRRNPVMEIGGYNVKLTSAGRKHKFFAGFSDTFPVFHWHADTFSIPKGGRLLATGTDCKNQAFSYGNSLGLLFHLEVTSKTAAKWADIYRSELKQVGKTKRQVVNECRNIENQTKELAYKLMSNFFSEAQ
jgi:GMP synthase (glutamine-hydrolysing)